MARYEEHKFFCVLCGKEGIPVRRKEGFQHKSFHLKKLYCPWCKMEVNHVECKNPAQVNKFLEDFKKGVYNDERKHALDFVRMSSLRQEYLGKRTS